jgi:Flagellar biosynthesis protein, FliO
MTDEMNTKRRGPFQLPRERLDFLAHPPAQRPARLPAQAEASLPKIGLPPLPPELFKSQWESPIPQAPTIAELPPSAFHEALRECEMSLAVGTVKPAPASARPDLWVSVKQLRVLGSLARTWSWLQSKSAYSSTKRLRLAETVSLGEKRFVAIVSVENREYLIGGAPSGVSLLAQWGKNGEAADLRRPAPGAEGHSL